MRQDGHRFGRGITAMGVALWLGTAGAAWGAIGVTIGDPEVLNYTAPRYVIDSDAEVAAAGYDRNWIPLRVVVGFSGSSLTSESGTFRAGFRLVDEETGDPVVLQGGDDEQRVFSFPQSVTVSLASPQQRTFDWLVAPAERLDAHRSYRVEAVVQRSATGNVWVGAGTAISSTAYAFIHFRGPRGTDAAVNVVARLDSVVYTRRYLVETDPTLTEFTAGVGFTLHRYDDPTLANLGAGPWPVTVRFEVDLLARDPDFNVTPLAVAQAVVTADPTPSLAPHQKSGVAPFERPSSASFNRTIRFRPPPGEHLSPVTHDYALRVRITHVELPALNLTRTGNDRRTTFAGLLHYNGSLRFGDVATTMKAVTDVNTATATFHPPTHVLAPVTFGPGGGELDAKPGYTYGPGTIQTRLLPNGDAVIESGATLVNQPLPSDAHLGLVFSRVNVTLTSAGAAAARIDVRLPPGLGWAPAATDRRQNGQLQFEGPIPLTPGLLPAFDLSYAPAPGEELWIAEETKPVVIRADRAVWWIQEGRLDFDGSGPGRVRHVRAKHYEALEAAPVPTALRIKPSNDAYWRYVSDVSETVSVRAGSGGSAWLTADFSFESPDPLLGSAVPLHFPRGGVVRMQSAQMQVVDDLVVSSESELQVNTLLVPVTVPISADCVEPDCGSTPPAVGRLVPDDQRLRFTTDGGLVGPGDLPDELALRWGWIPGLNRHAHATDPFGRGSVHVPGHFLRGDLTFQSEARRPAVLLFSGANPNTGLVTERPGDFFAYRQGLADYAGINLRVGASGGPDPFLGESTLGGGPYGPYELKPRSKYYVRRSGISGIHDKVQTAPETVLINDYEFTFLNFGLAFLSNQNVDSRTEGSLFLPDPTDDRLDFERLMFLCNGALDRAEVKNGPQTILASYWAAPIDVATIEFDRDPALICDPGEGYLALGVTAFMAHVQDSLQGRLGIFAHGNFIPRNGGPPDLDSRLLVPSQVRIRGPRRAAPGAGGYESYVVTPTVGAFFNTLGNAPDYPFPGALATGALEQGLVNLPGLVKVSFFQALEAHLQTSSHRPPEDLTDPGLWGSAPLLVANGRWGNPATSYFAGTQHDPDNRGFPGTTASQLNDYRTGPSYWVRARQKWLSGAISLDYPVQWDFSTRSFRSAEPVKDDFVVLQVEQRVAYLSAERAELKFGAQAGLPQLNLANFVVNTLDDATGMAATVTGALGASLTGVLNDGLDRIGDLLADRMDVHYERVLGSALNSLVLNVHNYLLTQWTGTGWQGAVLPNLDNYFGDPTTTQLYQQVWTRLGAGTGGTPQIQELRAGLDQAIQAIDALVGNTGLLRPGPGGMVEPALVQSLARALVQELAGQVSNNLVAVVGGLAAAQLDALLAPHLETAGPTLAAVRGALLEVRGALVQVRDRLDSGAGNDFRIHLHQLFQDFASGELSSVHHLIRSDVQAYLGTFNAVNRFHHANPELVRQKLRRAITDRFHGTAFVAGAQVAIKQRVFDLNGSLRSGLDSSFAQVNQIVRGALTSVLLDLDDQFNGLLGFVGPSMASAALDGYAIFNGDALRQVRLDAKFQWSIPEKTTFRAFLEINQYESGSDETPCGPNGKDAAEVILGALDVPFDFLSPELRVDIGTKFSFDIEPGGKLKPIGFAGWLKKTAGEITFEAFAITDLAVAVAFGQQENYLSAGLGLRFNSYQAKGGIFFGRTCTLQPIMMWDMFVASALGQPQPTFTGAYVYGEAHIPVSEALLGIPATCFFRVNAGMGLGVFYFTEGPTFGARGSLSISGDALCILSLGGRVDMVGLKQGSKFKLQGQGRVYVEIGVCPLCIEASRTVRLSAETGGGKAKGGKPSVK